MDPVFAGGCLRQKAPNAIDNDSYLD